jgi:hypothetical protein
MDFHENLYLRIFRISVEKIQFSFKSDNNGYFTYGPIYVLIISRSILVRMRNATNKKCKENQNTRFNFNNFLIKNRVVYEIMCKNTVEPGSI